MPDNADPMRSMYSSMAAWPEDGCVMYKSVFNIGADIQSSVLCSSRQDNNSWINRFTTFLHGKTEFFMV
jgi:hypothetical protein